MKIVSAATFGLCVLICFAVSIAHAQDSENTDKTTTFSEVKGKVVDSRGKPIEKFKVTIQVYDYSEGFQTQPKIPKKWEGEFENGEFQFDVEEPISFNNQFYIHRTVTADGYMEASQNRGFTQLSAFKGDFKKIKLLRGVKIVGKVVLPTDQSEEEPGNLKVHVAKKMSGLVPDYNNMFQRNCTVKEDGTFEATVPEDCKLSVTASCDNAATTSQQFTIKKSESLGDEQDLGEIKLEKGVSVSGTVVDRDGEPVEGQIVQMQQTAGSNVYIQNTVYGYAVTDADGEFTLPPRVGKCTITLAKQAYIRGKRVKVKGKLIMAKAIKKTLKIGQAAEDIEIKEGKAWKIYGVIVYDLESKITPQLSSSSSNGQQTEIKIDDDGNFEFEVVDGSTPWMSIYGYEGSTMHMAQMSSSSAKQFGDRFSSSVEGESTWFQLKKVTDDIGPMEFRLVKQLVDDRSWSEHLFDWYYFGE